MADFYIDLHSGDDYEKLTPYVYYAGKAVPEVMKVSRQMAEQVDVPYMVKSEVSSGGSYNYAASCGIPSVLLERGGMGAWETEEVRSMKRDVRSILRFLGIYDGHRSMRKYYPLNVNGCAVSICLLYGTLVSPEEGRRPVYRRGNPWICKGLRGQYSGNLYLLWGWSDPVSDWFPAGD